MGHYIREDLPFYYALVVDAFTVCDQNYCSLTTCTSPRLQRLRDRNCARRTTSRFQNLYAERQDRKWGMTWKTYLERLLASRNRPRDCIDCDPRHCGAGHCSSSWSCGGRAASSHHQRQLSVERSGCEDRLRFRPTNASRPTEAMNARVGPCSKQMDRMCGRIPVKMNIEFVKKKALRRAPLARLMQVRKRSCPTGPCCDLGLQ
jgi:phospholipase C